MTKPNAFKIEYKETGDVNGIIYYRELFGQPYRRDSCGGLSFSADSVFDFYYKGHQNEISFGKIGRSFRDGG